MKLQSTRPRSPEHARSVRMSDRSYCRRQWVVVRSCSEALDMLEVTLALVTLTAMEIVLGIDNIIFIAIVAGKLPDAQQPRARQLGLAAALVTRLLLLASLSFILGLDAPLFV